MRPFWADPAGSPFSTQIHPALTSFADEVCATIGRLFAYVGTLALIAMLGIHFWRHWPELMEPTDTPAPSWSVADRTAPAFALSAGDPHEKSVSYTILRHPDGGRKDVFSWMGVAEQPAAELEIYRMGGEAAAAPDGPTDLALRMPIAGADLEAAGIIDSKFGRLALLRPANDSDIGKPNACLGFFKRIDDPLLSISGWTCQGDSLPARRSMIACMLERLTLLSAGHEPKIAELFAQAELRRRGCGAAAASGDWITEAANPQLRGPL